MTAIQAFYRDELDHGRAIRLWLYAVAALVFVMVLVGGATRLTESGLSITEWQPVTGVLPPMNDAQWLNEFQRYQAIPQYTQLNAGMSLADFKTIYWWEWAHRLIGRIIGVAFFLPLVWFAWRGWIPPRHRAGLWMILALGALQGAIGWWMVASGLADRVEVSQYRLATHLVLACVIYVALVWTAVRWPDEGRLPALERSRRSPPLVQAGAVVILGLLLVQLYLGALVAGLRAGHAYNTWPLIDGGFIPQSSHLLFELPLWRNFFENPLTVQFDHRMLGYAISLLALLQLVNVAKLGKRGPLLTSAALLAAAVIVQAALGVWTLLSVAALPLALLHQATAMVTLTFAVIHAANAVRENRFVSRPLRRGGKCMGEFNRQAHWQEVYKQKGEYQVSWFQDRPAISLQLIEAVGAKLSSAIIDVGGGASRLADALVEKRYQDVTVLDLSESAVSIAKARLGDAAAMVNWIVADVTQWEPQRQYDLWHDRAAFHFLIEASDRAAYIDRLRRALSPGGHAIIGTFALDGPERCSGLPVVRYDAAQLSTALGSSFALVDMRRDDHMTPWGAVQHFQFSVFRRA